MDFWVRYIEFSLPVATRNAIAANRPQLKKKKIGRWLRYFKMQLVKNVRAFETTFNVRIEKPWIIVSSFCRQNRNMAKLRSANQTFFSPKWFLLLRFGNVDITGKGLRTRVPTCEKKMAGKSVIDFSKQLVFPSSELIIPALSRTSYASNGITFNYAFTKINTTYLERCGKQQSVLFLLNSVAHSLK